MKLSLALLALCLSGFSLAADHQTLCGVNTPRGEQIRLLVDLHQNDDFDRVRIIAIDGAKPLKEDASGAGGFGPHGYERLSVKLPDGCNGTAVYSHYDAAIPMNPMVNLTLKCICKR